MPRDPSPPVRVLVVDDQPQFRHAMTAVVDECDGFAVVGEAASGEESLLATEELAPDLVLMDVNLPGIDGIEASRRINERVPAPVVVLLSTYDEDDFDLSGCGAATYVSKASLGPDRLHTVWREAEADRHADGNRT